MAEYGDWSTPLTEYEVKRLRYQHFMALMNMEPGRVIRPGWCVWTVDGQRELTDEEIREITKTP